MKKRMLSIAIMASLAAPLLPTAVAAKAATCPPDWSPVRAGVMTAAAVGNPGRAGGVYCARYHAKLSERRGTDVWVVGAPVDLGF